MKECRTGIPYKGILLIKKVKSASHSTHSGSMLTRHHCCCGGNNGVGRDLMTLVMVVVMALLVFVGTYG